MAYFLCYNSGLGVFCWLWVAWVVSELYAGVGGGFGVGGAECGGSGVYGRVDGAGVE